MQIILVLFLLGIIALLALVGSLFISLILGIVLSCFPRAKPVAPVFLLIIPSVAIGALFGGVGIGYFAVQHDEHLIFLGPLGGIVIGGIVGFLLGLGLAIIWWFRRKKVQRDTPQDEDKPCC
jgi:hypothetical protein